MALVDVAQVAALLPGVDLGRVEQVAALVEDKIRGEVGARLTDPPQPGIGSLAVEIVVRLLDRPRGVTSSTIGSVTVSYAPGGEPELTGSERRRLRRAVGLAAAGATTIAPPTVPPRRRRC